MEEFSFDIVMLIIAIASLIAAVLAIIVPLLIKRRKVIKKYYSVVWKNSPSLKLEDLIGIGKFHDYYEREEDSKILENIKQNNNLLVIGRSLSGKSRAIYEVLKKMNLDVTVPSCVDIDTQDFCIPWHIQFWRSKIIIIDDLHEFVDKRNFKHLLNLYLQKSINIIGTCRSNGEYEIFKEKMKELQIDLSYIFGDNIVNIKDISEVEAKKIAKRINKSWDNIVFDGTIGSIFLETPIKLKDRKKFITFDAFNIYDFESILQASDPIPFRPDGPRIPDFEIEDWLFIPIKAQEIYKIVQEGEVVILGGKPATGKTVISRYIGFKYLKSMVNNVYYIDFPNLNTKEKETVLDDLNKIIKNPKFKNLKIGINSPLFIFENVHDPELIKLQFGKKSFINSLKALNGRVKIILTTRGNISEKSPFSWIKEKNRINLDELPSINKEIIDGILNKFNIKREENGLAPIKWEPIDEPENLWLLGLFLRISEYSKNQTLTDLKRDSDVFKNEILKYYKNNFNFPPKKVLVVMLILSTFSRYEIYIEEDFILKYALEEFGGLNPKNTKEILNELVLKNEILSKERKTSDITIENFEYRIPHIKLAEILQEYWVDDITNKKLDNSLKKYFEHGKNASLLGENLWQHGKFKKAIKCFKLVEIENTTIESILSKYKFNIKVSDKHVSSIELSHNKLTEIPKELACFSKIRELKLNWNQIREIENLKSLKNLRSLELKSNKISNIKGLEGLNNLNQLNLSENNISEIKNLESLIKLEILDLSHNKIKEIKNLNHLIKVKILNLSHNPIKLIKNLKDLTKLEIFNLRDSNILKVENLESLTNLRLLDLRDNKISEVSRLESLPNLKVIDLSGNKISEIKGLDKLNNVEIIKPLIKEDEETLSYNLLFKILLIGDSGVGKTSFARRYCYGFFKADTKSTIGVDFYKKSINLMDKTISLTIWDMGGEERFRSLLPLYCKGALGAFFLYDTTNPATLDNLPEWITMLRKISGNIPIMLIGSKIDLGEYRKIPKEKGILVAKKFNFSSFGEISSKAGINVEEVFEILSKSVFENLGST